MAAWRLSKSQKRLSDEVDAAFPGRSKVSDGTIGDTAHSARKSDHNPVNGIVHAKDYTEWDPNKNVKNDDVGYMLGEFLRTKRDPRTKYCISRGRMFASYATRTRKAWEWGPYSGPNGHFHHLHHSDQSDDGRPWGFTAKKVETYNRPWINFAPPNSDASIFKAGGQLSQVTQLQELLLWVSVKFKLPKLNPGKIDGKMPDGGKTELAWLEFQNWERGMQKFLKQPVWARATSAVQKERLDILRFWAHGG